MLHKHDIDYVALTLRSLRRTPVLGHSRGPMGAGAQLGLYVPHALEWRYCAFFSRPS